MSTFFLTPDAITSPTVRIAGALLHHLRDSLRLRPGDRLYVNDGVAARHLVEITDVTPKLIEGRIVETRHAPHRTTPRIVLAQALLKGEKMDWVIQKATELGVDEIVPVHTRHSVIKLHADRIGHQLGRWERIAHDAAQQSERWTLPLITEPQKFENVCAQFTNASLKAMLTERSDRLSIGRVPLPHTMDQPIVLFVGPEGGWAEEEQNLAQEQGLSCLTLGPRILRAETAAIAALSIVQSRLDERS